MKEFLEGFANDVTMVRRFLGGADLIAKAKVGQPGTEAGTTSTTVAAPPSKAQIIVVDPDGIEHPFDTQAQADAFQEELDRLAALAGT